jgi:glycerol-3-phosphate O-acyltransferase
MDLYNLLRLPEDEQVIPYQYFKEKFEICRQRIFQLKEQGRIDMAPHLMTEDLDQIIDLGISNVGMYHSKRPLIKTRNGDISTQDLNTLYYYHNRLSGYELETLF